MTLLTSASKKVSRRSTVFILVRGDSTLKFSGLTVPKGFKINTNILTDAENHNLVPKSAYIYSPFWEIYQG